MGGGSHQSVHLPQIQIKLTHRFVFVYNSWLAAYTVIILFISFSSFQSQMKERKLNKKIIYLSFWRSWLMNEVIEELLPPLKLISLILYCGMKCYVFFSPSSPIIHLINSTLIPFVFSQRQLKLNGMRLMEKWTGLKTYNPLLRN